MNIHYKACVTMSIASSVLLTPSIFAKNREQEQHPNILVFIADDAGMDFGCYGNPNIKTPNIDKIAQEGIRFEKAFLTAPQSSPSRTSLMTGEFAHTLGTEDLHTPIDLDIKMIPHYLKQAGYFTGSMFKTHWGPHGDAQFDRMIKSSPKNRFSGYEQFIKDSGDTPFFLWCGFTDPHRGYNRETCPQVNDPSKIVVPPYFVENLETKRDLADYYDEISRMDGDIGTMINVLEKSGKIENTIIVFLSDNGMPFPRCKGSLYDSGIQTPLLFMWKNKIKKNSIHNNGLISAVDLAPTLLELAGSKMGDGIYGKSFMPILFDSQKRGRDFIFAERNWHNTDEYIRCIRREDLKLIYNAYYEIPHGTASDLSSSPTWYELKKQERNGSLKKSQSQIFSAPRPMVEIYDLKNDPHELDNVADKQEYYIKGRRLSKLLIEWQKETKDHPWWKRRRPDQNDRITGFPLFPKRDDFWVE